MANFNASSGASDPWEPLERSEHDLLVRLGAAILANWDHLPRERQQAIFTFAANDDRRIDLPRLRRQLAVVLHSHHKRTSQPRSAGVQPTHDFPPGGPHARADLTNPDATPGSGLFPKLRQKGREVDPGGG